MAWEPDSSFKFLAIPFTSCVILDKFLKLFVSQLFMYKMRMTILFHKVIVWVR